MITCPKCQAENADDNSFCEQCREPLRKKDFSGLETRLFTPQDGPQQGQPAELQPGSVFAGRYTIREKIGQGGMGMVYRAVETLAGQDREIALKVIRSDRLADKQSVDKLIGEGALTQDIRHPNVVGVYNVGEDQGQPFVAMEFVNGVSLREWLRGHKDVALDTAAAIIRSLLDGLDAAHRLNVVHRDLKPENVILTGEPDAKAAPLKILDFGIARAANRQSVTTGTGLGTPHYMAPEQITNPDSVEPSADFYSLSTIFYELLVGVLPQGHWQPPSGGRPNIPTAIDKLIESGLSNRPGSRPQSAADYRTKLDQALKGGQGGGGGQGFIPPIEPGNYTILGLTPKALVLSATAGVGALVLLAVAVQSISTGPTGNEVNSSTSSTSSTTSSTGSTTSGGDEVSLSYLSGQWLDGYGGAYAVAVDNGGNFSGSGLNAQGLPSSLNGNVMTGTYQVMVGGFTFNGTLRWDNLCHIDYTTYMSPPVSGQIHIDHQPGGPCPPRFTQ